MTRARQSSADHRNQEEGRSWRPSWRRMEGGLCRFCHRHDVAVHCAVADELERQDQEGGGGYFNDPRGTANLMGTTMTGNGENVTAATDDDQMKQLKEKLEAGIKAKKELEKLSKQIEITITPEGLRIEMLEDKNGTFYEMRQRAAERRAARSC